MIDNTMRRNLLLILILTLALLASCSPLTSEDSGKLTVVVTTNIIGDVVSNIGGDSINLTTLIGTGQDPHSFEPTPRDLAAIEDADLVFINGLDLEEILVHAIENTATGKVITVSAGIGPLEEEDHHENEGAEDEDDHGHAAGDPHFWVDPNNVMIWVENITNALSAADPANDAIYAANSTAYLEELHSLDTYIREQTDAIPAENRKLVTDHGLYGYFAEEYGYQIVGAVLPTFTTTAGASAGDVAELAELISAKNVTAVFIGTTASQGTQNLADALSEELSGQIQVLPLLSGSLAPEGQPGDTYLGYMRYNIDQIVLGLAD